MYSKKKIVIIVSSGLAVVAIAIGLIIFFLNNTSHEIAFLINSFMIIIGNW